MVLLCASIGSGKLGDRKVAEGNLGLVPDLQHKTMSLSSPND